MKIFKTTLAWDGQVYGPGDPIPVSLRDHNHAEYKRLTELGYIGPAEPVPEARQPIRTRVPAEPAPKTPKKGEQNAG